MKRGPQSHRLSPWIWLWNHRSPWFSGIWIKDSASLAKVSLNWLSNSCNQKSPDMRWQNLQGQKHILYISVTLKISSKFLEYDSYCYSSSQPSFNWISSFYIFLECSLGYVKPDSNTASDPNQHREEDIFKSFSQYSSTHSYSFSVNSSLPLPFISFSGSGRRPHLLCHQVFAHAVLTTPYISNWWSPISS